MSNLEAAQYYARDLQWPIFPVHWIKEWKDGEPQCSCGKPRCTRAGKHPIANIPGTSTQIAPSGHKNATNSVEKVTYWWTEMPKANIGLATGYKSGVIVVDCDGEGGKRFLREKVDKNEIPVTWRAKSGGGGYHLFFQHPGYRVKSTAKKLAPDVDIRADGGYIILPPSTHPSGGSYIWNIAPPGSPGGSDETKNTVADRPLWLDNWISTHRTTATLSDPIPDKIPDGVRDDTMVRLAGKLKRSGIDPEGIRLQLHYINKTRCDPPLPPETIEKIVRSSTTWPEGKLPIPDGPEYGWLSREAMSELEPPEWLVEGFITKVGLSTVYGDPGIGKTFLALSLGLSVAYGKPWFGHEVQMGPVAYIAAEGAHGLEPRIEAWEYHNQVNWRKDLPSVTQWGTLPVAAQLLDPEEQARALDSILNWFESTPVLIVIDTLARSMVGGEENSARDVGLFVQAAEVLKRETQANILMIHHAGKSGDVRGSTALTGATDTMIKMEAGKDRETGKKDGRIDVICDKQKDFQEFDTITLNTQIVEFQEMNASLVLVSEDRPLIALGRDSEGNVARREANGLSTPDFT